VIQPREVAAGRSITCCAIVCLQWWGNFDLLNSLAVCTYKPEGAFGC
jgi:hypothetical protein